jgi:hypothetical protein
MTQRQMCFSRSLGTFNDTFRFWLKSGINDGRLPFVRTRGAIPTWRSYSTQTRVGFVRNAAAEIQAKLKLIAFVC